MMMGEHTSGGMARLLNNDPTLKSLTIDGVSRFREMLQPLVVALKSNAIELTSLEILAGLNESQGLLFADALKQNTTIKTLKILGGLNKAHLVRAVAEALKVNTTITSLVIFRYPDDLCRDMFRLADALKVNTTLETMEIVGELEEVAAVELEEALQSNTTLTSVKFGLPSDGNTENEFGLRVPWATPSRLEALDRAAMRNREWVLERSWWHLSLISKKSCLAVAARVLRYDKLRVGILEFIRHEGALFCAMPTRVQLLEPDVAGLTASEPIQDLASADLVIQEVDHDETPASTPPQEAAAMQQVDVAGIAASQPIQDVVPADPVIEEVEHDETPARILPQEAAAIQQAMWTGHVESQIGQHEIGGNVTAAASLPNPEDISGSSTEAQKIHLLRFGSAPAGGRSWERFREVLLSDPRLAPCRDALRTAGIAIELLEGALLFIAPEHHAAVKHALNNEQIRNFHIIISEDFFELLFKILSSQPFRQRPKLKKGEHGSRLLCCAPLPHNAQKWDVEEASDEEETWELTVKRTFLCYAPQPYDARSVTQSSTDVHAEQSQEHYAYPRGSNPRCTTRGRL